jgi:hypothetical protein
MNELAFRWIAASPHEEEAAWAELYDRAHPRPSYARGIPHHGGESP